MNRKYLGLFLILLSLHAFGQSKDGFSLEMFGAATSPINAFPSAYAYEGVKEWTELPFEAGAGFAFRQNAGNGGQWGLKLSVSRMAFGYAGTSFTDNNGDEQETKPVSTRRIFANFSPLYSFQLYENSSFSFELENALSIKIPLNAYSLARDAAGNNVDIDDLQNSSLGVLTVYQAQVAPTFVWGATRLGIPLCYNVSSGDNWELLSGWSAGISLSYFIEE